MGDRSNVSIIGEWDGATVLYSHWGGTSLFKAVQEVLGSDIARRRWSDASYLRRIIFQSILDRAGLDEYGFGISSKLPDNEHQILVLDTESQRVAFHDASAYDVGVQDGEGWTFEEFLTVEDLDRY